MLEYLFSTPVAVVEQKGGKKEEVLAFRIYVNCLGVLNTPN
jgi:hypothetical protein